MPGDQSVNPGRYRAHVKSSGTVRDTKVRVVKNQNDGTHVRMNMAENFDDPRTLEFYGPNLAFGIAAQVKTLGTGKRKDVMKERVTVGKVNGCSCRNREYMGDECFIDLPNGGVPRRMRVIKFRLRIAG